MRRNLLMHKKRYVGLLCMILLLTGCFILRMPLSALLAEEKYLPANSRPDNGNAMVVDKIPLGPELQMKTIRSILQDPRTGILWFATDNLFASYNGYEIKTYKHRKNDENSLSHDVIKLFYQDSKGRIWIGTLQGLDCFEPESGRFSHYKHGLENEAVTTVFEDRDGTIWVGGLESDLHKIDEDNENLVLYAAEVGVVNVIFQDRQGILWLGTDSGILSLNKENGEMIRRSGNAGDNGKNRGPIKGIGKDSISAILEDSGGVLWFGDSEGGLSRLQEDKIIRYAEQSGLKRNSAAVFLYEKDDRYIRLGGEGESLYAFDRRTERFVAAVDKETENIVNERIFSRYDNGNGTVWLGTANGLFKVRQSIFANYNKASFQGHGLSDDNVSCIYEDEAGILWLGSSSGLNRLDTGKKKCVTYRLKSGDEHEKENLVQAIMQDRKGRLWLGTQQGLNVFDKASAGVIARHTATGAADSLVNDKITALCQDKEGSVWIGTMGGGLWRTDEDGKRFFPVKNQLGKDVSTIFEDSRGNLWVGFRGEGLARYDKQTGEISEVYRSAATDADSLSDGRVTCISENQKHDLLIGTLEGGINQLEVATGKITHYREEDGLPSDTIAGVAVDEQGDVWAVCNGGVAKRNADTGLWRVFDGKDGLLDSWFYLGAYYATPKALSFGGPSGLQRIFFEAAADKEPNPTIMITDIKKRDESIIANAKNHNGYEVDLSYKDYAISFEYAAVDLNSPENLQYAYKLEGVDAAWVYCGTRRYASYTNLSGGEYLFRVKVSNGNGVWSEAGPAVKVNVQHPPWKTGWAYLAYTTGGAGLVYGVIAWRIRRERTRRKALEKWNQELEEQVEGRTQAVRNLLDNVGQGLLSFDRDLLVDAEYSSECLSLFGANIARKSFPKLVFPNDKKQAAFLHKALPAVFEKRQLMQQQVYLSLLPAEIILHDKNIRLDYKMIESNSGLRLMVIITNVTEQRSLEKKMEAEQQRNLMVAKVAARYDDFAAAMRAFQRFYSEEALGILEECDEAKGTVAEKMAELFRRVHTFKGEFSQFEMAQTVKAVHEIETRLQELISELAAGQSSDEMIKDMKSELTACLQGCVYEDMSVLIALLGEQFLANEEIVKVRKNDLQAVEEAITALTAPENRVEISNLFSGLRKKELKELLAHYPDYVARIGEQLGKMVVMEIGGDRILLDAERYYEFTKALAHIFRNGVDHGIESLEERVRAGKNPCANMYCQLTLADGEMRLIIEDDGGGVDIYQVRQRATALGLLSEEQAECISDDEALQLLFHDGFSTKQEVGFLSGRGAGLSAVRKIVEEMGGKIEVETQLGVGSKFVLTLPLR